MEFKNLAGLSAPLCKLVETIDRAGAGLCRPWQIRRVASADADATVIRAEATAAADAIAARARDRILNEELRQQQNIECIVEKASASLPETVSPQPVGTDWFVHFLTESRNTGDNEMQELWGRLLAGELASPGAFSKRTVTTVKLMEPMEATLFNQLCQRSARYRNYMFPAVDDWGQKRSLEQI